jgi:outer membrane protein
MSARTISIMLAILATRAHAQPGGEPDEQVTIARLVELAVKQSTTMQIARNTKREADLGGLIAGAPAQWQLQGTAGVDTRHDTAQTRAQPSVDTTHVTASVGVAKQVVTGGELSLTVGGSDQIQALQGGTTQLATTPDSVESASGNVTLSMRQPLLRGRGNGASVDVHKAELAADAATFQLVETDGAALRDIIEAYWELAYARANLAVTTQAVELANQQLDQTRKMYNRGTVADSAIAQAQYGVAVRKEAELRAIDDMQSASLALRKLVGLEIGPDLGELVPSDDLVVGAHAWDMQATVTLAIAHNPRIAAARRGVTIAGVELDRRDNFTLPALDLTAGGSVIGSGADVGAAASAIGNSYTLTAGVQVAWEVGGSARASAKAARIDRANAKLTAQDVERDVVVSVIDGVRRIRAAQQRATVAASAIDLAESNLRTEQALFRADKSTNALVFQRETELDQAKLLAARAAADYQIALGNLEYLTGHLLARYNVEVTKR